jgi:hypothetical protein
MSSLPFLELHHQSTPACLPSLFDSFSIASSPFPALASVIPPTLPLQHHNFTFTSFGPNPRPPFTCSPLLRSFVDTERMHHPIFINLSLFIPSRQLNLIGCLRPSPRTSWVDTLVSPRYHENNHSFVSHRDDQDASGHHFRCPCGPGFTVSWTDTAFRVSFPPASSASEPMPCAHHLLQLHRSDFNSCVISQRFRLNQAECRANCIALISATWRPPAPV